MQMIYLQSITSNMKQRKSSGGSLTKPFPQRSRVKRNQILKEYLTVENKPYRLLCVLKNDGKFVGNGHYWVILRSCEMWYIADDDNATCTTFEVLQNENPEQIQRNGLNIALFYVRVG